MTQDQRSAELRDLRRGLLAAGDGQVRRLVALVDRVGMRGEADALIAPLRPRLAMLRPPRPLSLVRLLFLPLDPLILPPSAWRPGAPGIPRVALRALAEVAAAGLGPEADALAAAIEGRTTQESEVVAAAGVRLWPQSAAVLAAAAAPPGWTEASGLHVAEFAPLASALGVLLAEGPALYRLAMPLVDPPASAEGERLLDLAAAAGPLPLAMMLALLLARLPQHGHLLQYADDLAARGSDAGRMAPERALDFLLAGVAAEAQSSVDDLRRAALLLETLVTQSLRRPARAAKLEQARRHLDDTCRTAFAATAASLAAPPHADAMDPEATARQMRRLDAVGRRLGGAAFYDSTLKQTAEQLGRQPGLSRIARLRLAEILLGPDAALALLGA